MARLTAAVLLALALGSCAPSTYYHGRRDLEEGRFEQAAAAFREQIRVDPLSAEAWRELGVALYNLGEHVRADSALAQARRIAPDLRAVLYHGLVREELGDEEAALRAFRRVLDLRPEPAVRRLANAHFEQLVRKEAERIALRARETETGGTFDVPGENSVAVVAFDSSDLPGDLAPLGLGLAEFTALDLGKVAALQVVERLHVDRVLDEIDLMASDLVDPSSRVRAGRLVGSRRLVVGTLQVVGDDELRLYGEIADVVQPATGRLEPISGQLASFFRLQKQLVFAIVDDLGVTLSPAERAAIEVVPTESFLAFLAYCRGLALREQGMYREAVVEFRRARQQDGGFQDAAEMETLADDVSTFTGGDAARVIEDAGLLADLELGQFLGAMQGDSGIIPTSLETDVVGPPNVIPPRTGSLTGIRIIIGGDYR